MPAQFYKRFAFVPFLALAVFVSGCASSGKAKQDPQVQETGGKVSTRAYVADKERVDQDMQGGNFGYISGTPKPEDRSNYRKTRRIYVLEVTKEPGEIEIDEPVAAPERSSYERPSEPAPAREPVRKRISLPSFDEGDEPAPAARESMGGEPQFTEYIVEKNDTLQKISKKHYNTYSRWMKIYDANKDRIKDPNRIKAGMVLRIPVE
ncbi:MAG: LysM peptidoglycan-binding domain-containing protein [Candidatus Omnitrophota bacterium]|nr:LysM peptidoglycan-binding domain-containing protein [Candidatus Omnitrophota bacterium]MDZ4241806.1 LysM peptidoglycan-binding domain-containing protein [Candidatus Omnitrophota bacterium]